MRFRTESRAELNRKRGETDLQRIRFEAIEPQAHCCCFVLCEVTTCRLARCGSLSPSPLRWGEGVTPNSLQHRTLHGLSAHALRLPRPTRRIPQRRGHSGRDVGERAEDGAALFRTDVAIGNALLRHHLLFEILVARQAFEAFSQGRD